MTIAREVFVLAVILAASQAISQVTITADQIGSAGTYDKVWQKRYDAGVNSWGIVGNHVVTSGTMWLNSFPGTSGIYRITFGVVLEEDGQPGYKITAGGRILKQGVYPWPDGKACAGKASKASTISIGDHQINAGEKIEIWGKTTYECAADHGAYTRWHNLVFAKVSSSTTPEMSFDKSSLSYSATEGYTLVPAAQSIKVSNSGTGTLPALTATTTADWLKVTVSGTDNTQSIKNEIIRTLMTANTYSTSVSVKGTGVTTKSYTVTFVVKASGSIAATAMLKPAQGDSLEEGKEYALVASGQNLGWSYDASSDGLPATPIGSGDTVLFTIPSNVTSPRTIAITVKGDNGTVTRTFPITARRAPIRLIKPNGGETFAVGATMPITWTTDTTAITDVNIFLSSDNGKSWLLVNPDKSVNIADSNWQNYSWVIPKTMSNESRETVTLTASTTCLIRIGQYDGPVENTDISDRTFTLTASQTSNQSRLGQIDRASYTIRRAPDGNLSVRISEKGVTGVELLDLRGTTLATRSGVSFSGELVFSSDHTIYQKVLFLKIIGISGTRIHRAIIVR